MIIGFTGHRDKITNLFQLAGIQLDHPGAKWIHGGAKSGFDAQVHKHILRNQPAIPFEVFEPEYDKYPQNPKYAPLARNREKIVEPCDLLVACYDGRVHGGTYDTIRHAKSLGKEIYFVHCMPIYPEKIE